MHGLQNINITAEIINGIICLILLYCVMTAEYRRERLHKIFVLVVSCHIPLLAVDTVIFALEGSAIPSASAFLQVSFFLSFLLGAVLLILFTRYLMTIIQTKTSVSKNAMTVSRIAIALCCLNIICIIITPFNGMYYSIVGSTFQYGNLYWLSQFFAAVCIMLNTGIVIAYRKNLEKRELLFLLSYAALPAIALVIQNMVDGVTAAVDVAATLTILIFYAGIQSEQDKLLKERELELTKIRIDMMLSQIQPHFLYNSLSAIENLCDVDIDKTKTAINDFAHYLRGNLESIGQSKEIEFYDELEHVETYLSLEKLRFGDKLNIVYDIETADFSLPPLTVQPIVENAVRHGITKKRGGGTLRLHVTESEQSRIITVEDDGIGFDTTAQKNDGRIHIGVRNVRERLATQCGGTLEIESKPGSGTKAIITIPKPKEERQ